MQDVHFPSNPNLIEVPVGGLQPGMYVAELDCPWLETPFALQGFVVKDEADVDYVGKYCSYVYVDPQKKVSAAQLAKTRIKSKRIAKDPVALKSEFSRAEVEFESAGQAMERIFTQIQTNRRVDVQAIQAAINPLIDSVFRNREALAALVRLKKKNDYIYSHSLSTAIWGTILGRHLGLSREDLEMLAMGLAMMDVGMTLLPNELLDKSGKLDAKESATIRGHIKEGLRLVTASGTVAKKTLNVIACHHERYDGSGYPQGLVGNAIPLLGRIAGLVDTYDAMITERPHAPGRSSFEAIQEISDMKEVLFQGALVEQFVQIIGMFPTGTIVELNTGEVGVVVQQNPTRRLRPKVVLILDADKNRGSQLTVIDLSRYLAVDGGTSTLWISKELKTGSYGISPDDYFI
jgi:HD-GYP domain-containing protein (c-di-GMP phosphodiesterase class II)